MSKLKVRKGIKGISSISSVVVLAAAGVLSTVSLAQAADYKVILRCVNPSLFSTCELDLEAEDENDNFQDDAFLNCDFEDRSDTVIMTDLDADTTEFEIFTDARNFATGTQNDCDIETDAADGSDANNRRHRDDCFLSASKIRYCQAEVVECGSGGGATTNCS